VAHPAGRGGPRRPIDLNSAASALDRHLQPRLIHRFQQIVDRVDLERFDGVLVVGGDEDDLRRGVPVEQAARDLEAGQARHLHVEEHHVGLQPLNRRQRFDAVPGVADDLDTTHLSQQVAELVPGELLVVHHDGPQVYAHAVTRSGTVSSGISTLAHVPSPGMLVSFR
jgi:hypothetical protein